MRWTKKNKKIKQTVKKPFKRIPRPEVGDKKIEIKFALFPVKINKNDVVWLEDYKILYEFKKIKHRRQLPMPGLCNEDGSPHYYDGRGLGSYEYEDYFTKEWREIGKDYINKTNDDGKE